MRRILNITVIRALVIPLLVLICLNSNAQIDPVYSQYTNNLLSVNPSVAGIRGVGSASIMHRKQWVGFAGTETSSLTFSTPIHSAVDTLGLKDAVGFDLLYDRMQPLNTFGVFGNYSHRVRFSNGINLSMGIKAGFNYYESFLKDLYRTDPDDPYIDSFDENRRKILFNSGVGFLLYDQNYYFGFAIPRLINWKYTNGEYQQEYDAEAKESRHYFVHGGYGFDIAENIVFKPALTTIFTAGAPVTADFDFAFLFNDQFWFGAMYRLSDGIGAYAQVQLKTLKVGVAYDYSLTRLKNYNNGTFEILLRVDMKTSKMQRYPLNRF